MSQLKVLVQAGKALEQRLKKLEKPEDVTQSMFDLMAYNQLITTYLQEQEERFSEQRDQVTSSFDLTQAGNSKTKTKTRAPRAPKKK